MCIRTGVVLDSDAVDRMVFLRLRGLIGVLTSRMSIELSVAIEGHWSFMQYQVGRKITECHQLQCYDSDVCLLGADHGHSHNQYQSVSNGRNGAKETNGGWVDWTIQIRRRCRDSIVNKNERGSRRKYLMERRLVHTMSFIIGKHSLRSIALFSWPIHTHECFRWISSGLDTLCHCCLSSHLDRSKPFSTVDEHFACSVR